MSSGATTQAAVPILFIRAQAAFRLLSCAFGAREAGETSVYHEFGALPIRAAQLSRITDLSLWRTGLMFPKSLPKQPRGGRGVRVAQASQWDADAICVSETSKFI